MTNFLVALGILLFTLLCIYGIEWTFARKKPSPVWTAFDTWFFAVWLTDLIFFLLLLPLLLYAVVALVLLAARFMTRLIVGRERARTMWIESLFDWVIAIPLRMTPYHIVKPPQT